MRVTLLQVITDPRQQIRVVPWYHEWLSKTPISVKRLLGNPKFLENSAVTRSSIHHPDSVTLVLRVHHPESWIDSNGRWRRPHENDLRSLLQKYKAVAFANPEYRPNQFMQNFYPMLLGRNNSPTTIAMVPLANSTIPRNAPELTVEFYEHEYAYSLVDLPDGATPSYTLTIPNPLYTEEHPAILKSSPLPASVTHDGVTVTLDNVYSKYSQNRLHRNSRRASSVSFLGMSLLPSHEQPAKNAYPRAKGTLNDPYTSTLSIAVTENGKAEPDWKVKTVQPYYTTTKDSYPFARSSRTKSKTENGIKWVEHDFSNDIGVLNQPVKVHATLVRQNNFPPDESVTIDVPLPTEGSGELLTSATANFWNIPVHLNEISHSAPLTSKRFYDSRTHTSGTHVIQIHLTSRSALRSSSEMITSATLLSETAPPEDFTKWFDSSGTASISDGRTHNQFVSYQLTEPRRHRKDPAPPLINMADYTTLSLTITQPRDFPHTFEFIVEPTEIPE